MFENIYPYTDFHEMNLDWFLENFQKLQGEWNKIKPYIPEIGTPFVTPEMFGAKGDGITDDTEAITKSINSKMPIYFSAKTYLVSASIACRNNSVLFGDGAIIKLKDNSNTVMVTASNKSGIIIRGIKLDQGEQTTQTAIVYLSNCTTCRFEDITIDKQNGAAYVPVGMFRGDGCEHLNFINCHFSNAADEGLYLTSCNECNIIGGEYYNTPNGSAIALGGYNNKISDVSAHNTGGSVIVLSGNYNLISHCIIENSTLSNGITFGHSPDTVEGGCITNCIIKGFKIRGIHLGTANNVEISNCYIDGLNVTSGKYGIAHSSGGSGCIINNCYIKNCYYGAIVDVKEVMSNCHIESCTAGIYSSSNGAMIIGCTINNCTSYGIFIGATLNAIIESCYITECVIGINLDNRGAFTSIKNCIIRKCSTTAIKINHGGTVICSNDLRALEGGQTVGLTYVGASEAGFAFNNILSGLTNTIPSTITQNNNIL